mmetsp:Transcript_10559/g.28894  ORF Transcript_10559/g.28894 Transcript_10559/m.28894 type:complete len:206 (+) Transcript_10559:298-915(+)
MEAGCTGLLRRARGMLSSNGSRPEQQRRPCTCSMDLSHQACLTAPATEHWVTLTPSPAFPCTPTLARAVPGGVALVAWTRPMRQLMLREKQCAADVAHPRAPRPQNPTSATSSTRATSSTSTSSAPTVAPFQDQSCRPGLTKRQTGRCCVQQAASPRPQRAPTTAWPATPCWTAPPRAPLSSCTTLQMRTRPPAEHLSTPSAHPN